MNLLDCYNVYSYFYFEFESYVYLDTNFNRKKDGNVELGMEKRMTMITIK
jgi:hypothetical protein